MYYAAMSKFSQITCICQHCLSEYQVQKHRSGKTKYCSSHCRAVAAPKRPVTRVTRICACCSAEYEVIKSRVDKTRFCSLKCNAIVVLRNEEAEARRLQAVENILAPGRPARQAAAKERKRLLDRKYHEANKDEQNAANCARYYKNREEILKASKDKRIADAGAIREARRARRQRNVERARELRRADYQRNKTRYKANARRREIDKMQATPSWSDLSAIMQIYLDCERVSAGSGVKHHVDHVFPLKGKNSCGLHVPWNLQILTAEENIKKSNSMPPDCLALAFVGVEKESYLDDQANQKRAPAEGCPRSLANQN